MIKDICDSRLRVLSVIAIVFFACALGCSSQPQATTMPAQFSRLNAGMTREGVRQTCGDDGSLVLRSGFGSEEIEVRTIAVRGTFRSFNLLFRNQKLAVISPGSWTEGSPLYEWSRHVPQFPAEDGGEALAIRTFEKGALPFHADFSAVDLKEKEDLQHANDETNGMIIGLTWWNPIAWVGTPIVLVCLAAQNRDEQTFAQEIDKIQLGARLSDVTKALGDASARISRPDNIVYLVYARSYGIATIGFRDGVVRGVYPVHDARTAAKTSSF